MRVPRATASSTKLPPMKPAPPVTSQVFNQLSLWRMAAFPAADAWCGRIDSERNVVVGEVVHGRRTLGGRVAARGRIAPLRRPRGARAGVAARLGATFPATTQHLHVLA